MCGDRRQTSRVETDHLEMELDHDTGEMHGRVLKGMFVGRDPGEPRPCRPGTAMAGPPAYRPPVGELIEAYPDRIHPTWREDMARGGTATAAAPTGA